VAHNDSTVTDEVFDTMLAFVLRAGVLISAAVVACGGVLFLIAHGFEQRDYHVFHGEPGPLRSVSGIISRALAFDAEGIIQFGLLLLIATPIARVVFSVVGFARQRDWLYVGITILVLALLTYSLLGS
jgi:uncharacterized membrane protein